MFEELKEQYRQSLPDKISAIKILLQDIRAAKPDAEAQLRQIAHTLHGSGATFGYPEISTAAKEVEYATTEDFLKLLANLTRVLVSIESTQVGGSAKAATPAVAKKSLLPILVAEDDDLMVSLIRQQLLSDGLRVEYVNNGAAAVGAIQRHKFSLLILDVQMPIMDGFEALSRIRVKNDKDQLPVIMLTGLRSENDVARGYELGANDYITKPFDPEALLAKVKAVLKIG